MIQFKELRARDDTEFVDRTDFIDLLSDLVHHFVEVASGVWQEVVVDQVLVVDLVVLIVLVKLKALINEQNFRYFYWVLQVLLLYFDDKWPERGRF